jgi:hypothetical protein
VFNKDESSSAEDSGGVAGALKLSLQRLLFVGPKPGGMDFADLMAEQFETSGVGDVVDNEGGFGGIDLRQPSSGLSKRLPQRLQFPKAVEQIELLGGPEQRLVIMGTVDIDEPVPEAGEGAESSR